MDEDRQDEISMAEMTKKLASEQPPVQEGSGTIAWSPDGGIGMTQNEDVSGQPTDGNMAQQVHQPAQGTDGGQAAGVNADAQEVDPDGLEGAGAPARERPDEAPSRSSSTPD